MMKKNYADLDYAKAVEYQAQRKAQMNYEFFKSLLFFLRVEELKETLGMIGLPITGTKNQMRARLLASFNPSPIEVGKILHKSYSKLMHEYYESENVPLAFCELFHHVHDNLPRIYNQIICSVVPPTYLVHCDGAEPVTLSFILKRLHYAEMKRDPQHGVELHFYSMTTKTVLDHFPKNLSVYVNNLKVNIPARPKPININAYLFRKPHKEQTIKIQWTNEKNIFYAEVSFVKRLRTEECLPYIHLMPELSAMDLINEDLRTNEDVNVTVICPISGRRMTTPGRSIRCTHLQCFDLEIFIDMRREYNTHWVCPICKGSSSLGEIFVDFFLIKVMTQLREHQTHVKIYQNGTWKVTNETNTEYNNHGKNRIRIIRIPKGMNIHRRGYLMPYFQTKALYKFKL